MAWPDLGARLALLVLEGLVDLALVDHSHLDEDLSELLLYGRHGPSRNGVEATDIAHGAPSCAA